MAAPIPPQSNSSPLPSSNGASWRSVWGQHLSWLISALSGTLEIEAEHKQRMREIEQDNEKLDRIIWQTKNETEEIRKDNERLAILESKIDSLFSKYGINSPPAPKLEEP